MKHKLLGADLLPHEFLLKVSQGEKFIDFVPTKDGRYSPRLWRPEMKDRIDCAKAAAPYFAPRLQSNKHSVDPVKVDVEVSDNEVARRVAFLLAEGLSASDQTEDQQDNDGEAE